MTYLCEQSRLPILLGQSSHLLAKVMDDQIGMAELAQSIQLDPVLSAKLLRVANSPFYGVSGQISSIEESLVVIGLSSVRGYIQTEMLRGITQYPPWNEVNLDRFWSQALWMGCAAYTLANRCELSSVLAMSTGLFHNIGMLVLLGQEGDAYQVLFNWEEDEDKLARVERELFGVDHGQMGGEMLAVWKLPPVMVHAVAQQYVDEPFQPTAWMTEILKCAHVLHRHREDPPEVTLQALAPEHCTLFELKSTNFPRFERDVQLRYNNLMLMVGYGNGDTGA
ncbi:MAG TPA: HDOD domain-containing protein [Limnobacter sp.]|uniref:HDOD domain-containing protein n=1 Tax=Limnobacter sp. TaxID=2003368 RepID=UPI002ED8CE6F